jgi:ubiquinone/menaquinone biosynthesis C-methylase UbiE
MNDDYRKYIQQQLRTFDKTPPIKNWRKEMKNPKSNQELINMVPKPNPGDIAIDIGAGSAYHSEDLINMGYEVYAIELSQKRVNDAHEMGRLYIQQGDMHNLPWSDNYASLAFCHETIEHSYDPVKVLCEICRVLKPGGTFLASCPLEGHWREPQIGGCEHNLDVQDNHPWKPTAQMLHDALTIAGFHVFEIKLYVLDAINYKEKYKPGKVIKGYRPHAFVEAVK